MLSAFRSKALICDLPDVISAVSKSKLPSLPLLTTNIPGCFCDINKVREVCPPLSIPPTTVLRLPLTEGPAGS